MNTKPINSQRSHPNNKYSLAIHKGLRMLFPTGKSEPMTVHHLLQWVKKLPDTPIETPREAEILLAHCLQKPRSYLFTWPEHLLTVEQCQYFYKLLQARLAGTPIAYLIGQRDFWTLQLTVNQYTLIPRPESELLVEQALEKIPTDQAWHLLDLGTGSGAIALALAKERPKITVWACDISQEALQVAADNAKHHQVNNVHFVHSDWFAALPKRLKFDMIVSNPPYIAEDDQHLTQGDLRFEPYNALASGVDGLNAIRYLISQAATYLQSNGWVFIEHGYNQQQACQQLFTTHYYQHITHLKDLSGQWRLSYAQAPLPH